MRIITTIVAATMVWVTGAFEARAAEPINIHAGGEFRKLTRDECNAKAMATLRADQKFSHVELTADGFVLGWNDVATVLVAAFPFRDGVLFLVTAASKDNFIAERLRNEVREFILDPKDLPESSGVKQVSRKTPQPNPLPICWEVSKRGAQNTLRFFDAAAALAMEKQGMRSAIASKTMVFGAAPEGMAVAVLVPGANQISVNLLVIAVSEDDKEAARLKKAAQTELLKILFD